MMLKNSKKVVNRFMAKNILVIIDHKKCIGLMEFLSFLERFSR